MIQQMFIYLPDRSTAKSCEMARNIACLSLPTAVTGSHCLVDGMLEAYDLFPVMRGAGHRFCFLVDLSSFIIGTGVTETSHLST